MRLSVLPGFSQERTSGRSAPHSILVLLFLIPEEGKQRHGVCLEVNSQTSNCSFLWVPFIPCRE